jgi:hypothetical protein
VLDAVDRHQGGAARRTDQAILVMQVGM